MRLPPIPSNIRSFFFISNNNFIKRNIITYKINTLCSKQREKRDGIRAYIIRSNIERRRKCKANIRPVGPWNWFKRCRHMPWWARRLNMSEQSINSRNSKSTRRMVVQLPSCCLKHPTLGALGVVCIPHLHVIGYCLHKVIHPCS